MCILVTYTVAKSPQQPFPFLPSPTSMERSRKSRAKSRNFTHSETRRLLELVEELKPFGQNMWEHVAYAFNQNAPTAWPNRDSDSLRRKFLGLKNRPKPSGDPYCPPEVQRAKQIFEDIKSHVGVLELNDNNTEMCVNSSQHEDDDEDSTEENTVFVPDAPRASPRLGLTPEALVALKPERGVPAMSMAAQRRSSLDAVIEKLERNEHEREACKREENHDMLMMAFMSKLMGTSDSK
ncbi:hypothetical protein AC1031_020607 [Aphanomyces cochlioides]|nr:hypothetical protein AC1031_020607 [Aphanomyces cochlioides]